MEGRPANRKVAEWRNQVKLNNMNLKKLRESSTSRERIQIRQYESENQSQNTPSEYLGKHESSQSELGFRGNSNDRNFMNQDLKDLESESGRNLPLDDSDDEIKQHRQNIQNNFMSSSISAGNSNRYIEESKRKTNYLKDRVIDDSSDDEENHNEERVVSLSNQAQQREIRDEPTQTYQKVLKSQQVESFVPIQETHASHRHQIHSNEDRNAHSSNSQLLREIEKWKEEAEANINIRKRLENTILEIKKENTMLKQKLESQATMIQKLELSNEVFSMVKENHRRIEDDNRTLKE